ncbi:cystinosin homolog [Scylla paramamosain]|uniref:cystinosin homolog n=1 Tax=Scylla paramamosain TaxID=85552 RepID=UPI003082B7E7
MAATYAAQYFLVVVFLVTGVLLMVSPVALGSPGEKVMIGGAINASKCTFNTQDVTLQYTSVQNVTLSKSGVLLENVTLFFTLEGDNILKEVPNITLTPGSDNQSFAVTLEPSGVGHTTLVVNATPPNMTDVSSAFLRVFVSHSKELDYFSDVVGWVYFVAWSVSFYPQTYSNWRRRSVIGFHFDFLSLNVVGFFMYSVFNICLYWSPIIQSQYFHRHPYGVNPVQLNDVIFSIHAFAACMIQVFQCCMYERGDQHVSKTAKVILGAIALVTGVMVVLGAAVVVQWLDFLYYVSYVKLFITLIKYIPQAYYNYQRKSTSGWSIGNILLDFTGGTLSIAQMFILAYNYHDWSSIFGDPTKFGLGLFSVVFDIFFMIQHYVLYRGNGDGSGYHGNLLASPQLTHSSSLTESVSSVDYGATGSIH